MRMSRKKASDPACFCSYYEERLVIRDFKLFLRLGRSCMIVSVFLCGPGWNSLNGQQAPANTQPVQVRTIPVANGFYVLTGRGTNTSVSIGDDGVVLVNAALGQVQAQVV